MTKIQRGGATVICRDCQTDLPSDGFYLTKALKVRQPCKACWSKRRYAALAEEASLTASISTGALSGLRDIRVTLSDTDMDLY